MLRTFRFRSSWLWMAAVVLLPLLALVHSLAVGDELSDRLAARELYRAHTLSEIEGRELEGRKAKKLRIREGTVITDEAGYFLQDGDGAIFVTESGRELGGLRNLNLERIARVLKSTDDPESIRWSVSGVVTEFGDRNYLLISRAVFKSVALPPPPESLND